MNQDIASCASLVQRGDPDRFQAIMSTTVALREKLFPLYAFNVEVARAPWVTQETMIAEMRLQWWRDALEEIEKGGAVRRHEVVTPLASILSGRDVSLLDRLIEARRWDIYKDPFENEAHYKRYLDDTAGNLLVTAVALVGEADEAAVRQIAYADGLARWFQAIPKLEEQQRVPLVDGRPEALVALANDALTGLTSARRMLGRLNPDVASVLRSTWLAAPILKQVLASPSLVADGALGTSEFRKKFNLLAKSFKGSW
ncbi:squalene/phytoene synthase family protein [Cognatishimia sp. 1_MG-2023]|uniref:squalene/phytoene synthase family protein n=1 Tax=Cognatishimia sp. 1_MG-2023 TaxID=3062642 RepID=UPI0026E44DC0|nr:squalene/phytoene synthase family protein [Cognatishimia sp. 1_MG-2023]MDO6727331.1 squalene/phytoene synthase family protein [Cognatishimia sp. 1_MG-2023]